MNAGDADRRIESPTAATVSGYFLVIISSQPGKSRLARPPEDILQKENKPDLRKSALCATANPGSTVGVYPRPRWVQKLKRLENIWQGSSDRNDSFPNMSLFLNPVSFLVACIASWVNEHQQRAIEYLTEENRVLREQIGDRRLRFTDDHAVVLPLAPRTQPECPHAVRDNRHA
jgi:hypothetical protein